MNGENADKYSLTPIIKSINLSELPADKYALDDNITIITTNGNLKYSKGSLMRRFHLFDDYFTDFPDEVSIPVPYRQNEVNRAIFLDLDRDGGRLSECLECMKYFNPKQPDEYFQFESLDGVSLKDVLELADRLREEDIVGMMEAWQYSGIPLPAGGMHMPTLACIVMAKGYKEGLVHFQDYPSFSSMLDHSLIASPSIDFSKSKERVHGRYGEIIYDSVMNAIILSKSRNELRRCLTMLNVCHDKFGNVGDSIAMPYCIRPSQKIIERYVSSRDPAWMRVAFLFEMDVSEVYEITSPSLRIGNKICSIISDTSAFCITPDGVIPCPNKSNKKEEEVIDTINLDEIDFDDE